MSSGFVRPVYVMRGCNEAVTIWNRFLCPETGAEKFYKHVLPVLCKWRLSVKRGEYRSNNGSAGITNTLVVIVPFTEKYVPYDAWKELDDAGRSRFFTFRVTDLITKGALNGDYGNITGVAPNTETGVKSRFGAMTVAGFTDNTQRAKGRHFKVGCFYGLKSGF